MLDNVLIQSFHTMKYNISPTKNIVLISLQFPWHVEWLVVTIPTFRVKVKSFRGRGRFGKI